MLWFVQLVPLFILCDMSMGVTAATLARHGLICTGDKPTKCGDHCCCSKDTADCSFIDNLKRIPKLPSDIRKVFFQNKHLKYLSKDAFSNVEKLNISELYLRQNGIVNISKDAFVYLSHLELLDLSDNVNIYGQELSNSLGSVNSHQNITLLLKNVGLRNIPCNFFPKIKQLKIINLSLARNFMNRIDLCILNNLAFLKTLDLENNMIQNVTSPNIVQSLETLSLHGNRLSSQQNLCSIKGIFPNLRVLNMSMNLIKQLSAEPWACLISIVHLDLSQNNIKRLNMSAFDTLTSLKVLDLHHNWINFVSRDNGSMTLENINLSLNELTWPPLLCSNDSTHNLFPELQQLNISNNIIKVIRPENWNCLKTLTTLSLNGNDMRVIPNNSFSSLHNLTALQIANMHGQIEKIELQAFDNHRLESIELQSNDLIFSDDKTLRSIFKYCPNILYLDLSHNNLLHLNDTMVLEMFSPLRSLQHLFLQNTHLFKLPQYFLNSFTNLTTVDLSDNNFITKYLQQSFHSTTIKLKSISLRKNYIRNISEDTFSDSLKYSLEELDLTYNQFDCNCTMLWFRNWIGDSGRTNNMVLKGWPEGYKCRTPTELYGVEFKKYRPTSASCRTLDPMIVAYVTIACFLLLFTIISSAVYKNRWYIMYYFYKIKRQRKHENPETKPLLEENKAQFDAYVIYNENDLDFVRNDFKAIMEEKYNYKLNIWDRNGGLGGTTWEHMTEGIDASKNVIAIVSEEFLKDEWCHFQVNISVDRQSDLKRDYLMLVIMDSVNKKQLSKRWCVMFTKTTTADWCSDKQSVKRRLFEEILKQHLGTPITKPINLQ